jgi:hypothetical protein
MRGGSGPMTLGVQELRGIAAKHLRKARKSTGSERDLALYLARAHKFLADDEERLQLLDRAEPT